MFTNYWEIGWKGKVLRVLISNFSVSVVETFNLSITNGIPRVPVILMGFVWIPSSLYSKILKSIRFAMQFLGNF